MCMRPRTQHRRHSSSSLGGHALFESPRRLARGSTEWPSGWRAGCGPRRRSGGRSSDGEHKSWPNEANRRPAGEPDLYIELHEEIERLPEKYRVPIVLCHLQGHTHEQASQQLGWPLGTVQTPPPPRAAAAARPAFTARTWTFRSGGDGPRSAAEDRSCRVAGRAARLGQSDLDSRGPVCRRQVDWRSSHRPSSNWRRTSFGHDAGGARSGLLHLECWP